MLIFDIETDGLLRDVSQIHCLVIHDTDTEETSSMIKRLTELLMNPRRSQLSVVFSYSKTLISLLVITLLIMTLTLLPNFTLGLDALVIVWILFSLVVYITLT